MWKQSQGHFTMISFLVKKKGGTKNAWKMHPFGTLHTSQLRFSWCFLVHVQCMLKNHTKMYLPIEINEKNSKNASKKHHLCVFGIIFDSHIHFSQVQAIKKLIENASEMQQFKAKPWQKHKSIFNIILQSSSVKAALGWQMCSWKCWSGTHYPVMKLLGATIWLAAVSSWEFLSLSYSCL